MNDSEIRSALELAAPIDDDARERSWLVAQSAYDEYERHPKRRRLAALVLAAALLPLGAVGVAAASAPDSGVGRWVQRVLGVGHSQTRPALGRIPGGGRLLVQAGASAWVVSSTGTKRRLGIYAGTAWSPHGLFVVGWHGRELTALDPNGHVRWSLARPQPISSARWGPVDGFRIAYVAGSQLRVVWGDGSHDRGLAASAAVAPAWRPDAAHVLAYVDSRDRVSVAAADTRARLWRSAPVAHPLQLAWSPDASRLLVVTRRHLLLFGGSGRRLASRTVPAGRLVSDAEWAPRGGDVALVRYDALADRSDLVLADADRGLAERQLSSEPGHFGAPAWSPSASRLLLPWPDANQWLFLRPHARAAIAAVANIAGQFMPGARRASFPRSVQWCCAPAQASSSSLAAKKTPSGLARPPGTRRQAVTAGRLQAALRANPGNAAAFAACRPATAADRSDARNALRKTRAQLFACDIAVNGNPRALFDVQVLAGGCYVAERRRSGQADYGCISSP